MTILTKAFWKGATDRAIKTFFQVFVSVITFSLGTETIGITAGILDVSWLDALSISALATLLSVATSVGNADNTAKDAGSAGRRAAE